MLNSAQQIIRVASLVGFALLLSDFAFAQTSSQNSKKPKRKVVQVSQTTTSSSDDESVNLPSPTAADNSGGPVPLIASPTLDPLKDNEPEFLKTLPHPPEQPRSLLQPAPPLGPPSFDLEHPYITQDPILDPPYWAQPGWFFEAQVAPIAAHVTNQMTQTVTTGLGNTANVALGSTPLGWTVAPRLELGYRLASGLGEFAVSDTGFSTNGSQIYPGTGTTATRASSLTMNYTDIDYISREYTPFECWDMKWRLGARIAETYASTSVSQAFAATPSGSAFFTQQTNRTIGYGMHVATELERRISDSGFSIVGKIDVGDTWSRIRQNFYASLNEGGVVDSGIQSDGFVNQIIILNAQLGVAWQNPRCPNGKFYLGYVEENWFNVMANENLNSQGQFYYQGVVLRASWNY